MNARPGVGVPRGGDREGPGGRPRHGATPVGLCVVLVAAAVLAASAAILYKAVVRKARATQARTGLVHLQRSEELYFTEWKTFTDDPGAAGFDPERYDCYSFTVGLDNGGSAYTGRAHGLGAMEGDLWTVGPRGAPVHAPAARGTFE